MKRTSKRASALLITLTFVVLVTILVLGAFASMQLERQSSRSHLERARADLFAQEGVEAVIAALRQNTADTNRYWISQPGQLLAGALTNDANTPVDERKILQTIVPLSSGLPSAALLASGFSPSYLRPPNLNVVSSSDPSTHVITDRPDASNAVTVMSVKWIYVRKDGSLDKAEQPDTTDKQNPIVGRYAYWTDDESSKINYNTAWGRKTSPANTNSSGHPTKIDLTGLPGVTASIADAIHDTITDTSYDLNFGKLKQGFYNTPLDARRADGVYTGVAEALRTNKFEVTHYSHDPDTTFFGEPRIVLTTQTNRAGGRPFLDIGASIADLHDVTKLNAGKVRTTVDLLNSYLRRSDWPMITSGSASLQQKYYGHYPATSQESRLTQLSLNIIDYVRSKESPSLIVTPIRGSYTNSGYFVLDANVNATWTNGFFGATRTPKITEFGVIRETSGTHYAKIEVHLPRNFGIQTLNLNSTDFEAYERIQATGAVNDTSLTTKLTDPKVSLSNSGVLVAGGFVTIRHPIPSTTVMPGGNTAWFRLGLFWKGMKVELAPVKDHGNMLGRLPYVMGLTNTTTEANMTSVETDDPRINAMVADWKQNTLNTFDKTNSRYSVGKPASSMTNGPTTGQPEVDMDVNGNVSDASLYMPPAAGTKFQLSDGSWDDNTLGMVTSVAELGYIHSGIEGTTLPGIPWRTLHLQPSRFSNSVVPDWALMDLFTVPKVTPAVSSVLNPHGTSTGGRINLNSKAEPFGLDRKAPLVALLLNAHDLTSTTLSLTNAQTLADNIYNKVLSSQNGATLSQGQLFGATNAYDSPGEIVEIKGVADRGEASENLLREITSLISARGEVFSIHSIGQALRQTPDGRLTISAERRLYTMAERYIDGTQVRFKPLYTRPLNP